MDKTEARRTSVEPHIAAFDVFCGVGGMAYGLRRAGIKIAGGLDVQDSCRYAFEHNCSAPFLHKDIRNTTFSEIAPFFKEAEFKILAGCAPCQPFSSMANARRGRGQVKQWAMLPEFLRLIREGRPHVVLMENVPRLRTTEVFIEFVEQLKKNGFSVTVEVVACADYGVPQTRRRLLLLASKLGSIHLPDKMTSNPTVRKSIEVLPSLNAGGQDIRDPLHRCSALSPLNLQRIQASHPGGTWSTWPSRLRPQCYHKPSGNSFRSVYGRMDWDALAPTLTTQFYRYGTGRFGHPEQDRAISLREGALLQTFPLEFRFVQPGTLGSFAQVGAHIGNAVPPQLALTLGRQIIKHIAGRDEL